MNINSILKKKYYRKQVKSSILKRVDDDGLEISYTCYDRKSVEAKKFSQEKLKTGFGNNFIYCFPGKNNGNNQPPTGNFNKQLISNAHEILNLPSPTSNQIKNGDINLTGYRPNQTNNKEIKLTGYRSNNKKTTSITKVGTPLFINGYNQYLNSNNNPLPPLLSNGNERITNSYPQESLNNSLSSNNNSNGNSLLDTSGNKDTHPSIVGLPPPKSINSIIPPQPYQNTYRTLLPPLIKGNNKNNIQIPPSVDKNESNDFNSDSLPPLLNNNNNGDNQNNYGNHPPPSSDRGNNDEEFDLGGGIKIIFNENNKNNDKLIHRDKNNNHKHNKNSPHSESIRHSNNHTTNGLHSNSHDKHDILKLSQLSTSQKAQVIVKVLKSNPSEIKPVLRQVEKLFRKKNRKNSLDKGKKSKKSKAKSRGKKQ